MVEHIVLIGLKGCGKSTVGKSLAVELGYDFVDTDSLIEELYQLGTGESLNFSQIYKKIGDKEFRAIYFK